MGFAAMVEMELCQFCGLRTRLAMVAVMDGEMERVGERWRALLAEQYKCEDED